MKIILGASLSYPPFSPGKAWHRLHYLLGFRKLGHEVYFVEQLDPEWCVNSAGQKTTLDQSVNRELFQAALEPFGFMDRACLIYGAGEAAFGLSLDSLKAVSQTADLLINWSGHITAEFILDNVKRRVYVDLDPVFTQLWHAEYGAPLNFQLHDVFFSAGLNIGTAHTTIPDCGLQWHPVLPPVVLEYWPFQINTSSKRFTTVATLSPFGHVSYRGEWYGTKHDELRHLAEFPRRARGGFEVALKYYREEEPGLAFLKENGWAISDAARIASLSDYQNYISGSRGEFGIVQSAYVKAQSGWFSDRWSHYLASGRPVLAQSTGFERWVPTGSGLLAFRSLEEAVEGIEMINKDYVFHCRAAREFAEEHLDHRKVLPKMLELCSCGYGPVEFCSPVNARMKCPHGRDTTSAVEESGNSYKGGRCYGQHS